MSSNLYWIKHWDDTRMCFEGTVWLCLLWSVSHLGEVTAASGRPYGRSKQTGSGESAPPPLNLQLSPHRTGSRTLASNFRPLGKNWMAWVLWRHRYFHVFSAKDFNTKQAGHLKDKNATRDRLPVFYRISGVFNTSYVADPETVRAGNIEARGNVMFAHICISAWRVFEAKTNAKKM